MEGAVGSTGIHPHALLSITVPWYDLTLLLVQAETTAARKEAALWKRRAERLRQQPVDYEVHGANPRMVWTGLGSTSFL